MKHDTPASGAWVTTLAIAAAIVSLYTAFATPITPALPVFVLAGVLLLRAVMMRFTTMFREGEAGDYRLALALALAGATVLPPVALAPLIALCALPAWWRDRREAHTSGEWLAAVAPLVLAAHATALFDRWTIVGDVQNSLDLLALIGGGLLFLAIKYTLTAVTLTLSERIPFGHLPALQSSALLGDGLFALLGVAAAGIWLSAPLVLVLLLPAFAIAHQLTHSPRLTGEADVDPKTGLHNSRYFERAAAAELAGLVRRGHRATVLFADVDHFKLVNDRHGHIAGDAVLRDMAALITGTLRGDDIVARFGGEEFIAFLPGVNADEAIRLAERLRRAVESHPFLLPTGDTVRCTVSVGIATAPGDGTTIPALTTQADRAMYRAKQTRNASRQVHTLTNPGSLFSNPHAAGATAASRSSRDWRGLLAPVVQWSVVAGGGFALCLSLIALFRAEVWQTLSLSIPLVAFVILAALAGFFPIHFYEANGERQSYNFNLAVGMATISVFPLAAPVVHLVGMAMHQAQKRQKRVDKIAFNLCSSALAAACAALVYLLLNADGEQFTLRHFVAVALATATHYFVNFGSVAIMISLHSRQAVGEIFRKSAWLAPTDLLLGLTGAFVVAVYQRLGVAGAVVFAVPLLLMYVTVATGARKYQQAMETLATANAQVEQADAEKAATLKQLIEALSSVIDARDVQVSGHSRNVAAYAAAIAMQMGLPAEEVERVRTAGLLHDLGKVAIPERLLHEPEQLTPDEFAVVREHAAIGRRILVDAPLLQSVAEMIGDHHERWDGGGYPLGKQGDQISIGGRILAVADSLDTMTSDRLYSKRKPLAWALREVSQCMDTQFDPAVVDALRYVADTRGSEFFNNPPSVLPFASPVVLLPVQKDGTN